MAITGSVSAIGVENCGRLATAAAASSVAVREIGRFGTVRRGIRGPDGPVCAFRQARLEGQEVASSVSQVPAFSERLAQALKDLRSASDSGTVAPAATSTSRPTAVRSGRVSVAPEAARRLASTACSAVCSLLRVVRVTGLRGLSVGSRRGAGGHGRRAENGSRAIEGGGGEPGALRVWPDCAIGQAETTSCLTAAGRLSCASSRRPFLVSGRGATPVCRSGRGRTKVGKISTEGGRAKGSLAASKSQKGEGLSEAAGSCRTWSRN